ncbi:F-box protein At5g41720-like [Rutidosis leptorrhynchoides]|uniref:F-box protein At5g41720-like n=1 Tax=Rutidosis leptorrhynchoides TaxID=125765 RepID=UPI003A9A4E9E
MDSILFCSDDMKVEILSRTSLKTLYTLRCTSKEICSLTYSSYFWDLYKQRNDIVSGFLIQRWGTIPKFAPARDSKTLDLSFLPHGCDILASSEQGIVVFQRLRYGTLRVSMDYYVCKPSTKQVLQLPNPKTIPLCNVKSVAIVLMGSNPLHYKIIGLSEDLDYRSWKTKSFSPLISNFFTATSSP